MRSCYDDSVVNRLLKDYNGVFDGSLGTRGGVEDTRLEAKDTKKIPGQGQGQPFRGQNPSRPKTGMLEAKDQRHRRKRSPKKKGLQKYFSGDLQFIGVPRIFDCGRPKPQIA